MVARAVALNWITTVILGNLDTLPSTVEELDVNYEVVPKLNGIITNSYHENLHYLRDDFIIFL